MNVPYALTYGKKLDMETFYTKFPDRWDPVGSTSVRNVRSNYVQVEKRGSKTPFSLQRPPTSYSSTIATEGLFAGGVKVEARDLYATLKPKLVPSIWYSDKKGNVRLHYKYVGMHYPPVVTTAPIPVPPKLVKINRLSGGKVVGSGMGLHVPNLAMSLRDLSTPADLAEVRYYATMNMMRAIGHKKASFGITLAESHKTFTMIGDKIRSLLRAYRLVRRGKVRSAAEVILLSLSPSEQRKFRSSSGFRKSKNYASAVADETFSSWLSVQFGWMQLLSDIRDLNNVFKNIQELSDLPRVSGFGFSKFEKTTTDSFTDVFSLGRVSTGYFRGGTRTNYHSIKGYAKADYAIGDLDWFLLNAFGLANPAEIAWDLMPYSFVLDWFVPISNSLSALSASTGLTLLGNSISIRDEQVARIDFPAGDKSSFGGYVLQEPSSTFTRRLKLNRQAGFPAKPILLAPPIRYPKSLWHAMTAAALVSQRF